MSGGQFPAGVAIVFPSAREAERRIAGVAAAARIVRELAEAGCADVWLAVGSGVSIGRATLEDVHRLAGATTVRMGEAPAGAAAVPVPCDRLIPASALRAFLAGESDAFAGAIELNSPAASAELLRRTAKASDGPVSRWLNRPISRRLSALLLLIPGVKPVHATIGTAMLALAMFGALAGGGTAGLVAGGLLFHAASVFDGVDGEVARATFRSSPGGAALDTAVDTATTLLFMIGLTLNLVSSGHQHALALSAWGLGMFSLGLALVAWHASRVGGSLDFRRIKRHYRDRASNVLFARFVSFATIVSSRDFYALLFAVLAVAGLAMGVLYLFATAASVWLLFVAGSILPPRREDVAVENS